MARGNVELAHRAIEALNRRDLDAFLAFSDPDVEFTPYTVEVDGRYRGHDGIRRWWDDLFGVFPDWSVSLEEVREIGPHTLAVLRVGGHGEGSGTPVDQRLWQLAEWSAEGRVVRTSNHGSEAEALAAMGPAA